MLQNGAAGIRARIAEIFPLPARYGPVEGFNGQFGEDYILAQIFGDQATGRCAEIGAYDGRTGSATLHFEEAGWQCLLVEPNPECAEQIRAHRRCVVKQCAASSKEGETTLYVAEHVEQMSTVEHDDGHHRWIHEAGGAIRPIRVRTARLDDLLEEAGFDGLEFLTIDVEGHELAVLEGFTLDSYRPRVVIIEDNAADGDTRVARHMSSRGYVHFRRTGVNEWYARESDAGLISARELSRFERAKTIERWDGRRRRLANRVATRVGGWLPDEVKRPARAAFGRVRRADPPGRP
jgi:FkbM family methyltransferase